VYEVDELASPTHKIPTTAFQTVPVLQDQNFEDSIDNGSYLAISTIQTENPSKNIYPVKKHPITSKSVNKPREKLF